MEILIVGGGIAGSALALALRAHDLPVRLVEARPEGSDTEGAFLTLAPNGVNALRALGHGDVPAAAGGFELSGLDFHNASGRRIARLSGEDDAARYGARAVVLRRAALRTELARRAREAGVRFDTGARLTGLAEHGDGVRAAFADGTTIDADVVIGADGIWSAVRRHTWPDAPLPTYTGIVDCGGWTKVDLPDSARQQMIFGRRGFFGYAVKDNLAYWFTNVPRATEPARSELDDLDQTRWMSTLRDLYDGDPAPVPRILAATQRAVGVWPLYDLPSPRTWCTERVCLVGDAAHAVSPSTGQGASLAIEDAVVLARCLRDEQAPAAAFTSYQRLRKGRAEKIARFGRQVGERKASSATGSLFRDLTLSLFLRMGARATAEQYGYRVDGSPSGGRRD
ncbi:FAD-dependent monooxygenase [Prauserella cavernicola]|uniref:FAD-dependent monooxygenase n=1 Tax=Prauserella cavernicola TaxID=2800127 RepID=A0A934V1U9_9PSEU|nr:FAD-dependent monooxygenase [Prauserella cavernicola]MBK1783956.1 FAD-dependent monooxygenase [Prauserella cavernicola]